MHKAKFRSKPGLSGKPAAIFTISFFLLMILLISPTAASVNWEVSPSNPEVGDTLKITGTADPGQTLKATVSFGKDVLASGGTYIYEIEKVEIPDGENNLFTVHAKNVRDLNVKVTKGVPLMTLSKDATGGEATISQGHVPPWKYKVKIFGRPLEEESKVFITIKAKQDLKVDSEGNFVYNYDTGTLPPGEFDITIGGKTETITLKEKSESSGSESESETKPRKISGTIPEPKPAPAEPPVLEEQNNTNKTDQNAPNEVRGQLEAGDESQTQKNSSSKASEEKATNSKNTLDGSYLLFGLVAGLLINAIHLKRK